MPLREAFKMPGEEVREVRCNLGAGIFLVTFLLKTILFWTCFAHHTPRGRTIKFRSIIFLDAFRMVKLTTICTLSVNESFICSMEDAGRSILFLNPNEI